MTSNDKIKLDQFDLKILEIMQQDGRISNANLAKEIGLTPPSTLERVKKLTRQGFIEGYQAKLNKKKLGRDITCFIAFNLKYHGIEDTSVNLKKDLLDIPGVEEVHLITGRYDYIIKVNLINMDDLKQFILDKLSKIEYLDRLETFIAISSGESQKPIPIDPTTNQIS